MLNSSMGIYFGDPQALPPTAWIAYAAATQTPLTLTAATGSAPMSEQQYQSFVENEVIDEINDKAVDKGVLGGAEAPPK